MTRQEKERENQTPKHQNNKNKLGSTWLHSHKNNPWSPKGWRKKKTRPFKCDPSEREARWREHFSCGCGCVVWGPCCCFLKTMKRTKKSQQPPQKQPPRSPKRALMKGGVGLHYPSLKAAVCPPEEKSGYYYIDTSSVPFSFDEIKN